MVGLFENKSGTPQGIQITHRSHDGENQAGLTGMAVGRPEVEFARSWGLALGRRETFTSPSPPSPGAIIGGGGGNLASQIGKTGCLLLPPPPLSLRQFCENIFVGRKPTAGAFHSPLNPSTVAWSESQATSLLSPPADVGLLDSTEPQLPACNAAGQES